LEGSVFAKRDARFAQIIRGHLDFDAVAHVDANPVLAHLAGDMRQDLVSVRQSYFEHGAREDLRYRAGQLNWFFFGHRKMQ
jgi:hypothetical protein